MDQSNIIFGALLFAYIFFITLRGELPTYLTLLRGGGTPSASTGGGASSSGSGLLGDVSSALGGTDLLNSFGKGFSQGFNNPIPFGGG